MASIVDSLMRGELHLRASDSHPVLKQAEGQMLIFTETTAPAAPSSSAKEPEGKKVRGLFHKNRELTKVAGALLKEFMLSNIQKPADKVQIENVTFIASYNWKDSNDPVILVPGMSSIISIEASC